MKSILLLGVVAVAAAFADESRDARYYYDLGPATIDVSSYPKDQQANYEVFASRCSACHSLARPINSPLTAKKDWRRYISRMHQRAKKQGAAGLTKEQGKKIVDFLSYDSKVRKLDRLAEFERNTAEWKSLFETIKAERAAAAAEQGQEKAVPSAPYTGIKPGGNK